MLAYRLSLKSGLSVLAITTIFFLAGCTPHRFASVRFDAAELNAQLDGGAKYFILQFKAPKGENVKKPYELISYAYQNTTTPPKLDHLRADAGTFKFNGQILLGNNTVSRTKIEHLIIDSTSGRRVDYKYILLVPKKNAQNYIYYTMKVVVEGEQPMGKKDEESEPCPPASCHIIESLNSNK